MTALTRGSNWLRLLVGLTLVFALFHWTADWLGSDRGQYGLVVGGLVVLAVVGVERWLFRVPPAAAVVALGLGRPRSRGLLTAAVVGLGLLLVFPVYAALTGSRFTMYPGWISLLPGLFAQGGVGEEVLFRGFLFRRVREGRTFWRAVAVAAVPFVAVHLVLFVTLPWPVAFASVLLSAVISAPLAHLFELGGRTVWAPAIVHFVVQGAIKVVTLPETGIGFALAWMAASAVLPFFVFLVPRPEVSEAPAAG